MEKELIDRLEISFKHFLNPGEEFTIDYLRQIVEFSGKVSNLLLKIHDFVQERLKEGSAVSTGKKERDGLFTIYRKTVPVIEILPNSSVSGAGGAGSPIGFHGNPMKSKILQENDKSMK